MLNADQTAIQWEMASGRTLTIEGVKKVTRVVQRQAATTHSFTLQVGLSGSLPAKIFVVLYEPSGVPQNFNQLMHKYTNLAVSYTKSGWMDKQVAKHWLEDFLLPMIQDDSCLIIDAWRGYKMTELQSVQERNLKIVVLPEGTTPYFSHVMRFSIDHSNIFYVLWRTKFVGVNLNLFWENEKIYLR